MAKIDLRNHRPDVVKLPDGRVRATFSYDVREWVGRTQAELTAEVWLAWGTVAPGDFAGLRLVAQTLQGAEPKKDGSLTLLRVFEELPATDELQVGENTVVLDEEGGTALVAEFLQFSAGAATPGTVGTTTAPDDATCFLLNEQAVNDGTIRRIKRTYVNFGTRSETTETKNNGALILRTIVSQGSIPATPSGYTLISTSTKGPDGLPTYTYTFAKGSGTISTQDETKNNGALYTRTVRALGTPPSTPGGYTLVSTDSAEQDGYILYTYGFAKGVGTLSQDDETKNNGKLFLRTIRALGAAPSTPSGFTLTSASTAQQDGYVLYTSQFAMGSGRISTDTDTKNGGALVMTTVRYLGTDDGALPAGMEVSTAVQAQDGTVLTTKVYASGSGEISRDYNFAQGGAVDFSLAAPSAGTGAVVCTIRYLTASSVTSDPTSRPASFVRLGVETSDADGYRVWTVRYGFGSGLVADETDLRNNGALTLFRRTSLGSPPTAPGGANGALSTIILQNGGTGYTSAPTVAITGGGGSGATATAVLSGGAVISLALSSSGSGYSSPPTIAFSGGGGAGAAATATLSVQTIASVTRTAAGSGFTSVPSVAVSGGGGSGGAVAAVLTATTVASVALTSAGTGYTSAPTATISGGGGSGATATVNVAGGSVTSLTLTSAGTGYTSTPTVSFSGGGGSGATATCALTPTSIASAAVGSGGSGYTSAPTVSVAGGAAITAAITPTTLASLTITSAGSGYSSAPAVTISGGGGSGATAVAVLTGSSVLSITLSNTGSGFTSVPTVTLTGGGGSGAAAVANLTGTTLAAATLTNGGSGYTSAPTVSVAGGGGVSGAVTAVLTPTPVASLALTAAGSGYFSPSATISGGGGSGATATVQMTGGITGLSLTAGGSGYSGTGSGIPGVQNLSVSFSGGGGSGAVATVHLSGGVGVGVTIDSAGSGYTSAPTATVGGGGSGLTLSVSLSSAVGVLAINTGGSGYSSAPAVTISGGGGSGATAIAYLSAGIVFFVEIVNAGTGYTSTPTVSFSGGGGSGATATATHYARTIDSIILTNAGSGYTSTPVVTITGGSGSGATATATLVPTTVASLTLANAGNSYTSVPTLSFSGGGGSSAAGTLSLTPTTLSTITVSAGGSGYSSAPSVGISGGGGSGAVASSSISLTTISGLTLTAAGSGYTSAPSVSFSGGAGSGATATATITGTSVASLTVTNGGSGFTSAPSISFSGGGGSGASGATTLTGTTLTSLTLGSGGTGYTTTPTVVFTGGGGSGATATASTAGATITGFTLTNAGSGYTSTATVALSGGGGSGAAGSVVFAPTTVASFSVTSAGSGYTSAPSLTVSGGGGSGSTATAVLSTATVAGLTLTSGGSGYTSVPTLAFSGGGGSGAAGTATIGTSSVSSVTLTAGGTGYTSAPTIGFSGGGGSGATATALAGGQVVLISAQSRKDSGYEIYDYRWAQGVGEISRTLDYSQSSDQGTTGVTRTTIRYLVAPAATVQPTTLAGSVKIGEDYTEADGHRVWTTTWAKGTGTVVTDVALSNNSKLVTYHRVALGSAPTTPDATIGGTVMLFDSSVRKESGYDVYDYRWAEGLGIIAERTQALEGGLRLVVREILTGPGVSDLSSYTPTGIVRIKDYEEAEGVRRWTLATLQTLAGGSPISGTALSFGTMRPFTYPGRAKAITTTATATVAGTPLTKSCYDIYKSPPVTLLIDATVEITYQSSNALGALTNGLWNPQTWATIYAQFWGWNSAPRAPVITLPGYRSVSETPITFNGGNTTGLLESCLEDRVYGIGSGTPFFLKVLGGPAAPDSNTYTLAAELEPAFVDAAGTQYYRKTVVYAFIPAQTALPV